MYDQHALTNWPETSGSELPFVLSNYCFQRLAVGYDASRFSVCGNFAATKSKNG